MPTLVQLKYIVTVDKFKHFGKAAKACHVTQPSLSIQIQKAEEELNMVIFDRNKKPVVATAKGSILIEHAKTVLREHEKLIVSSKKNGDELIGNLTIAMIPTVLPYLLPIFLTDFQNKYKKINLSIEEMKTEDIIEALKNDQIDAGILATPLKEPGIKEKHLYYDEFICYFNENHKISKLDSVDEKSLPDDDIWLLKDGHCLRNQITNLCASNLESQSSKNFNFEGNNLETLRNLVKATKGFTLIPWIYARTLPLQEQRSHTKKFNTPVPVREIGLAYARDQWKKELLEALRQSIIDSLPKDLQQNKSSNPKLIPLA